MNYVVSMWCSVAGQHETGLTQLSEVDIKTPAEDAVIIRQGNYIPSVITNKLQTHFRPLISSQCGWVGTRYLKETSCQLPLDLVLIYLFCNRSQITSSVFYIIYSIFV